MTYANKKGRATAATTPPKQAPPPLSEADMARVAANRAFVKTHMPELVDKIRELVAMGLIDGWRAVNGCRLLEGNESE